MPGIVLRIGALAFALVTLTAASCSTLKPAPANKDGLRRVVGTSLVGVQGRTQRDQLGIDETAAGLCGAGIWTPSECARHGRRKPRGVGAVWRTLVSAVLLVAVLLTLAIIVTVWATRPVLAQILEQAAFRPDAGEVAHMVRRLRGWHLYDGAGVRIGRVVAVDGTADFIVIYDEGNRDE